MVEERKKENSQRKGGMGGRYTATTQRFQGGESVVLAVTYPWASASSFVTTAGDATPLWEDVTDPTCSGDTRPWASASSYLSSQSVADSRCNPHATRGLPTLVVLPPVASSSVAPLSSASFCSATAACRSLALAASPAFRRNSALLAA